MPASDQVVSHPPLVSIIIPTYNRPQLVKAAINSALTQTYQQIELIVVNDGGSSVRSIIESFNDRRIIYIEQEQNRGLPAARNRAIRQASGLYFAYLDDDDIYYPEHIETLLNGLLASGLQVAYSNVQDVFKREENGKIVVYKSRIRSLEMTPDHILEFNELPPLCVMHARACFEVIGGFDETLERYEDWDFYIRLSQKFPFLHIPKATTEYTVMENSSQMITAWLGFFLAVQQQIYVRYKELVRGKPEVKQAQHGRLDWMRFHAKEQLEQMPDEQIAVLHPEIIIDKIASTSLWLGREEIRGARALSGYLTQRQPNNTQLWLIYARLCRILGDTVLAEEAIQHAYQCQATDEIIREGYVILSLAEDSEQAEQVRLLLQSRENEQTNHINDRGIWMGKEILSRHYFDGRLAKALVKFFQFVKARSVADFGCGMGDYQAMLLAHNVDTEGYDGNPATPELSWGLAKVQDLSVPFDLGKKYEWILCLEVGEHIPRELEKTFIENLNRHAEKGVLLSWAVKGQGGYGHVNEQDNEYIKRQFMNYGFFSDQEAEETLRSQAMLPWFKQTIMVFARPPKYQII